MGELSRQSYPDPRPGTVTYRQLLVLDIVWRQPADETVRDDWAGELSQSLNEQGALWEAHAEPTERLAAVEDVRDG
jgi:hypothetical protein